MNEIKELFNEILDPNNPNQEKSGNLLLEKFCASIDLLFEIIQNEKKLRSNGVIILKRVLDLTLKEMSDYDQMRVFEFVATILIPKILPENPNYLSPNIYEIFSKVSQAVEVDVDSANEYIKKLTDPVFFSFIIYYLINLEPSSIDLEYSCGIMLSALDTDKVELKKLCIRLFVVLCNNFPEKPVFTEFHDKFIEIFVEMQSPDIWNILTDLSKKCATGFMELASSIFSNDSRDFDERVSAFYFFINNIDETSVKELPQLLNYLVEFQVYNLNNFDTIDESLFFLFPASLKVQEARSEVFEILKTLSFELLSVSDDIHQVIGLCSLGILIDNSPENVLIECIPNDLSIFRPFLTSEDDRKIAGTFEVLKIIIGKPICSHFYYEPIFQDIIELLLNGNDDIRNRAAIFSYLYSRSHFTIAFWIFDKFVENLNQVKISEMSIILDILAKSILKNKVVVSDSDIDSLISNLTEILNSNCDYEIKISAVSLFCSIIQKNAELTSEIAKKIYEFMEVNPQDWITNKTMSKSLIRFMKCTFGFFIEPFRVYYPIILQNSIKEGQLSDNYEPVLLTELIRWDSEFPDKDEFKSLLLTTFYEPPNENQYKISIKCLKKIVVNFPIAEQIQITNHICSNFFEPKYFKLIRKNIKLLSPMLNEKNQVENRVQIAQILASFLQPFSDNILKDYIGSICRLMCFVIRTIGPDFPENIKQICNQLYEKTMEAHYKLIFFVFTDCIRYSVVEAEESNTIISSAFEQLSQEFTSFDASCYLMCIKAGIEKYPSILTNERMEILVKCWEKMSSDLSLIMSKSYLANIFIYLGCHDAIPPELFVAAIQTFPMEVKILTSETCQLFLDNFKDLSKKDKKVLREIFQGIIRLLGAGKSIRYTHKVEKTVVVSMIKLGLEIANVLELDINDAIQKGLPESPRKQELVAEFFHALIS